MTNVKTNVSVGTPPLLVVLMFCTKVTFLCFALQSKNLSFLGSQRVLTVYIIQPGLSYRALLRADTTITLPLTKYGK